MAEHASLVRDAAPPPAMPGLDMVAARMANGLRDLLAGYGSTDKITTSALEQSDFGTWAAGQGAVGAFCRYRLAAPLGSMLIAFTPSFIRQLVDTYYGGAGLPVVFSGDFSSAETRFLTRIGQACGPIVMSAWHGFADTGSEFSDIQTGSGTSPFLKTTDAVAVQRFTLGQGVTIDCVYPLAGLRKLTSLGANALVAAVEPVDMTWRDALIDAVMHVHLPVRSIFARPEVPLTKLLSLRAGDVIPICLPDFLPVTVAGRHFADGTVGEASGRAAIKINSVETLQKGLPHHA